MRGEYASVDNGRLAISGSPPLARGILRMPPQGCQENRITPRLRGEYWKFWKFRQDWKGSPPLARGIQLDPINLCKHIRITPACAGNTREATGATATIRDHPRLRGEYIVFFSQPEAEHGSPPLARGIQNKISSFLMSIGITPACAGNTYAFIPLYGVCRDHPRLRGEYYVIMLILIK